MPVDQVQLVIPFLSLGAVDHVFLDVDEHGEGAGTAEGRLEGPSILDELGDENGETPRAGDFDLREWRRVTETRVIFAAASMRFGAGLGVVRGMGEAIFAAGDGIGTALLTLACGGATELSAIFV